MRRPRDCHRTRPLRHHCQGRQSGDAHNTPSGRVRPPGAEDPEPCEDSAYNPRRLFRCPPLLSATGVTAVGLPWGVLAGVDMPSCSMDGSPNTEHPDLAQARWQPRCPCTYQGQSSCKVDPVNRTPIKQTAADTEKCRESMPLFKVKHRSRAGGKWAPAVPAPLSQWLAINPKNEFVFQRRSHSGFPEALSASQAP